LDGLEGVDVEIINDTTLLVRIPFGIPFGPIDIEVTTVGGSSSLSDGFNILQGIPILSTQGSVLLIILLFSAGFFLLKGSGMHP